MFNWLGNIFPYSDLHSLNLDWILTKMKETAAQAAKAIADSANALAQVIEAKTAAQDAQTAAQNAQTAANNAQTAANNAADSAENAVNVAQQAKSAAQTAQNTANTAQSAAKTAQSAAQTAQSAAQNAQTAANNAQTAADDAQTAADNALSKFPVTTENIADSAVTNRKIQNETIGSDKLGTGAVTTTKIANGAVTSKKISATFSVGLGAYSLTNKTTSAGIAAGEATFSFRRSEAKSVIFVVYAGSDYNVGDARHHLFMYSDPFILNTISTKRVVNITLGDFNELTGENTEHKGTLTISVSAHSDVNGTISFAETLPYSNNIEIPYGINGLAARPLT